MIPRRTSLPLVMFILSTAGFVFVLGLVVGRYRVFPYPQLEFAKEALDGVVWDAAVAAGWRQTEHAAPARYAGAGVTRYDPEKAVPGLTLLSGFFEGRNELRLMRADGTIVRRWTPSFFDAFPDSAHIPHFWKPASDLHVQIHGALALPDGSVVFNFDSKGTVKMDRCGAIQWTVPRLTHHAVTLAQDGGFWIPSLRLVEKSRYRVIKEPILEPTVLKVGADGSIQLEISIIDLFFKNDLVPLLFANGLKGMELANKYDGFGLPNDVMHLNDVEELGEDIASAFPQFRPGSLLLSMRDYNLVMVADPRTLTVEWYRVGPWIAQHDPDFLPNGKISVFDNGNDGTETGELWGGSRITEIDPATGQTVVRYGGREGQPLYTDVMGMHQRLGGNLLIAETRAGRVLEVTEAGEIAWEYINRADADTVYSVTGATRYGVDYFKVSDWGCK